MISILKALTRDPAATKKWGWRVLIGFAFLVVLLVGVSLGSGGGGGVDVAVQTQQPGLFSADPPPGSPTATVETPQMSAEGVAVAFTDAWLHGATVEDSIAGQKAWVESMSPYVDGYVHGVLVLATPQKVPTGKNGKPLSVKSFEAISSIGDSGTLEATLSDGSKMQLTCGPHPDNTWRVTSFELVKTK